MELTVDDNGVVLDFSDSDDQAPGPINYLVNPAVPRAMLGMYLLAGDPTLLLNAGAGRAIDEVVLRKGSVLQPKWPAPLGQRGLTMMRLLSSTMGLVNAAGGESTAANCAYVIYFARGVGDDGTPFLMSDGVGVGYGARPYADGINAVYYVAQENYPAEMMEQTYPARLRAYGIHCDSGGPGRWRGGCGVVREIELLAEEATFAIRIDGVQKPAWGVKGGHNGGAGRAVLNPGTPQEHELDPFSDGNVLRRGDILRLQTGGGGGWGHPYDREPERVLADVLAQFVSRESALEDYGVVLSTDGESVDAAATAARAKTARRSTAYSIAANTRTSSNERRRRNRSGNTIRRRHRHWRHLYRCHPVRPGDRADLDGQNTIDTERSVRWFHERDPSRHREGVS